jgi:hypothetical protein
MAKVTNLFSTKELQGLDAKQLERLRDEMHRHLRTSKDIHKMLRAKVLPLHKQLTGKAPGRGT